MDTALLWRKRAGRFWIEIFPYFRYVASSGFMAFMMLAFIAFTYYYARFIYQQVPDDFTAKWIALAVFVPVLGFSPIRTFLKHADLVYLTPIESRMGSYLRYSFLYSYTVQAIGLTIVLFIYWPLNEVSSDGRTLPLALYLLVLLGVKFVNLYGSWQERQFVDHFYRVLYSILRWGLTALMVYFIFTVPLINASMFMLLVSVTFAVSLRLPGRYLLHWEHLVQIEQDQRSRYYSFISWFVEIPADELPVRFKSRKVLSKLAKRLPFIRENTYKYVYLHTFIRSDLPGMVLRITLFALVGIFLFEQTTIKAAIFFLGLYLIIIQLSVLGQVHRHMVWQHLYPLPLSLRAESLMYVVFRMHFIAVIMLSLSVAFTTSSIYYGAVFLLLGGGLSYAYCQKVIGRKLR